MSIMLWARLPFLGLCLQGVCADEASVLLKFRDALNDSLGVLRDWGALKNGSRSLSFCEWSGVTCNERNSVSRLTIQLQGGNGGEAETSIAVVAILGDLRELSWLELSGCNLSGSITPQLVSSFRSLRTLWLSGNQLSGGIPDAMGSLTNLTSLSLSENNLSGRIPPSLGLLSSLSYLGLSDNQLTGSIPATLANTSLSTLDLGRNKLTGLIPSTLGSLNPTLTVLDLSDNLLQGFSVPTLPFGNLTLLRYLVLSNNKIRGPIPAALGSLVSLRTLMLDGNSLEGPILPQFGNFSRLRLCLLSRNNLSGSIPSHLAGMANLISLTFLDLSNNMLEGPIPASFFSFGTFFVVINLSRNKLSGSLPQNMCLPYLDTLDLSFNQFVGTIPGLDPVCGNTALKFLSLSDNQLEGGVANLVTNSSLLELVNLRKNKFTGSFPPSLLNLPSLRVLTLAHNQFTGPIPIQITNRSQLQVLDLSFNLFQGSIPENVSGLLAFQLEETATENYFPNTTLSGVGFYELQLSLQLKGSEVIFSQILKTRTMLDLSSNRVTGNIPEGLGSLLGLRYLNLSRNQIQGPIPVALATVVSLESMDLSNNDLSGEIPSQLANLPRLSEMNVAHNNLSGYIPSGNQFDRFPDYFFEGNPFLQFQCGFARPHKCTPQQQPIPNSDGTPSGEQLDTSKEEYISVPAGIGFAVGFLTMLAFFIYSPRGWSYITNPSQPRSARYGFFSKPFDVD